jgi:hypothetical protein
MRILLRTEDDIAKREWPIEALHSDDSMGSWISIYFN